MLLESGDSLLVCFSKIKKELEMYRAFGSFLELTVDVLSTRVLPSFQVCFALSGVGIVESSQPVDSLRH